MGTKSNNKDITRARNKMNELRYKQSFHHDIEPALDLNEALLLGGFEPFKLDALKSLPEVIRPLLSRWESSTLAEVEVKLRQEVPGYAIHKKNLPPNLIDDIFNLYCLTPEQFRFVEADLSNGWRINLMQNLSHYYMRALTERNSLNAYIVTQELAKMLLEQLNPDDPDAVPPNPEDLCNNPGGGSGGNGLTTARDQALNKAQERIDAVQEAADNGTLPDGSDPKTGKPGNGRKAGKQGTAIEEARELLELFEMMRSVTISERTLGQFIQQSLKLSTTHFSKDYKEREVELLEADDVLDIEGLEYLLPQLRAAHLEDIVTFERHYKTGFDVYIDRSSSMTYGVGTGINKMRGIDLVKVTAVLLLRKRLATRVFFFDTQISEPYTDPKEVLKAKEGGGTITQNVVNQITANGVPSLILTDMQDNISTYTKYAYFVGILGAKMYASEQGKKFLTNQQFATFDGSKLTIVKS
jgi:hypothetical protein